MTAVCIAAWSNWALTAVSFDFPWKHALLLLSFAPSPLYSIRFLLLHTSFCMNLLCRMHGNIIQPWFKSRYWTICITVNVILLVQWYTTSNFSPSLYSFLSLPLFLPVSSPPSSSMNKWHPGLIMYMIRALNLRLFWWTGFLDPSPAMWQATFG